MATTYELPSFRTFEARSGPLPRAYADAIWGFHLRPAPGGRTRLGLTWATPSGVSSIQDAPDS